jgi:hypothetical protein
MSQTKRASTTDTDPTAFSKVGTAAAKTTKKDAGVTGSVPVMSFPAKADHPNLLSLTDKQSAYASVARTCLQLNQFAGSGSSSAASDDDGNVLFHDASFAKTISASQASLIECAQGHDDRRCRILACKTLALVARSAYARLRHSPLLFGVREGTLHRLEDEVGTDVPVALCSVALEDVDDGVSACAVEALGTLTLSNAGMVGTSVEDALLREVEAISHVRPSPHAPTLTLLEDDDYSIAQQELQSRVYENVLSPRLWRLVQRLFHYNSSSHLMRTLPFLTGCLGHLAVHTTSFGMDRTDYAKRWVEVDLPAMIQEVVSSMLLPSMQQNDGELAHTASICALRLVNVCPNASWVPEVCLWVVSVLVEQVVSCEIMEQKMAALAMLLIALRTSPLPERGPHLEFVVNQVRFLPSTTRVPRGVVSPGILSRKDGSYRRPARIGFLAEIALSFFVDDHNASDRNDDSNVRSTALRKFLSCAEVTAALTPRSGKKAKKSRISSNHSTTTNVSSADEGLLGTKAPGGKTPVEEYAGTHIGEEIVLAFCQVASHVGRRVMMPRDGKHGCSRNLEDWLRCSLAVLSGFSACVNWKSRTVTAHLTEDDHNAETLFTMLTAAQGSFVRLFQECLYTVGLVSPVSSVSLHIMPLAVLPDLILLEEMAQASISLQAYEPVRSVDFAHKDLAILADQFLEYKIQEGIPSRHMRIFLLALLTDHWVQSSNLTSEPATVNMNEHNANEILATLSEQILSLSLEIYEEEEEGHELRNTGVNEKYLRVCVACVENVALAACEWARRFGTSQTSTDTSRIDIDEDAQYIVSVALAALDGKNLRDGAVMEEEKDGSSRKKPMLRICAEAAKRINDASGSGNVMQVDAFGIGGEAPALYSALVAAARLDVRNGLDYTPYVSKIKSTMLSSDASHHAHLAQYCQQVIACRFDLAMWSSPLSETDDATEGPTKSHDGQERDVPNTLRAKNSLRLSAPLLPSSKLPKIAWGSGGRMCWKGSSSMVTAGSDPVAVMVTYVARRCPRYDGELEFHLEVSMRVQNITAVEIVKGVKLGLSVTDRWLPPASDSSGSSLDSSESRQLFSTSTVYRQEVLAGDHLMWEVCLPHIPASAMIALHPSVTFREIETDQSARKWVGISNKINEGSEGDDEDSSERAEGGTHNRRPLDNIDEEDEIDDITLSCESVALSPMASLQPCPLVFFRHLYGDENVFRFLWLQLPYRVKPLELVPNESGVKAVDLPQTDELANAVANISVVTLQDWIPPSGLYAKGWALATLSGKRLFCVLTVTESDTRPEGKSGGGMATFQFRGDDEAMVNLIGAEGAISEVISLLTSNQWCCADVRGFKLKSKSSF